MHEALTEQREEDVELAELIDRLRAMLVQGIGGGRRSRLRSSRSRSPEAAPPRSRSSSASSSRTRSEHGAGRCEIELARRNGDVVLAIADEGGGTDGAPSGTGLSIVRALVADELQGSFALNGARAEVVFPA